MNKCLHKYVISYFVLSTKKIHFDNGNLRNQKTRLDTVRKH